MCPCIFVCVYVHLYTPSGPLSPHQRDAIQMAFRWRVDGGPLLVVCWGLFTSL